VGNGTGGSFVVGPVHAAVDQWGSIKWRECRDGGPFSDNRSVTEPVDASQEPIPPWPGASRFLRPTIPCVFHRVDEVPSDADVHRITVHRDWRVTIPHDWEAERVSAALGGHSSCMEFVDRVVPAVRGLMPILSRQSLAPIHRRAAEEWVVDEGVQASCCKGKTANDAATAARHTLTGKHIAKQLGLPGWQVAWLVSRIESWWSPSGSRVISRSGYWTWWEAGLSKARADLVIPKDTGRKLFGSDMPPEWYASLAYGQVSMKWAFDVYGAYASEPDLYTWRQTEELARQIAEQDRPEGRAPSRQVVRWLRAGANLTSAIAMVEAHRDPVEVDAIVKATGWTTGDTLNRLNLWEAVGAKPTLGTWARIAALDMGDSPPSVAEGQALIALIEAYVQHQRGARPEVVAELFVMTVLLGEGEDLEKWLRAGVTSIDALLHG
jgi:hypothetical protein